MNVLHVANIMIRSQFMFLMLLMLLSCWLMYWPAVKCCLSTAAAAALNVTISSRLWKKRAFRVPKLESPKGFASCKSENINECAFLLKRSAIFSVSSPMVVPVHKCCQEHGIRPSSPSAFAAAREASGGKSEYVHEWSCMCFLSCVLNLHFCSR